MHVSKKCPRIVLTYKYIIKWEHGEEVFNICLRSVQEVSMFDTLPIRVIWKVPMLHRWLVIRLLIVYVLWDGLLTVYEENP